MKRKKTTKRRSAGNRNSGFRLKSIIGRRAMGGYSALKYVGLLLACVVVVGVTTGAIYMQSRGATIKQPLASLSHSPEEPDVDELAKIVNEARKANGLPGLETDEKLSQVANERLRDMRAFQYYSHQNLSGKYYYDYFPDFGFTAGYSCENLAIEFSLEAKTYVDSWIGSTQGHKECMLNKNVTKVGYAASIYSKASTDGLKDTAYLVVAIFAGPPFKNVGQ